MCIRWQPDLQKNDSSHSQVYFLQEDEQCATSLPLVGLVAIL